MHYGWFTRAAVCAWGSRNIHVLIEHALRCRECIVFGRNGAINRLTIETSEEWWAGSVLPRLPVFANSASSWFQKFCVGEGCHALPRKRDCLSVITHLAFTFGFTRYPPPASTKAPMGTILAQLAALPGRWCFLPLAATALRSMRWFDVQNLRVGGGCRVLPHREAERVLSFAWSVCLSFFQRPFVGAGLCTCPL